MPPKLGVWKTMYKLLGQINSKAEVPDYLYEIHLSASIPSDFLSDAVFAGDSFWGLEAAYGRVDGVVKTAAGYCGGSLRKPSYREVCEAKSGHTEAVKVTYDRRKIAYSFLCDIFWDTHDPTNKDFLVRPQSMQMFSILVVCSTDIFSGSVENVYAEFGLGTHNRSVIFYSTEEERKQAQESKIRRQMKINRRIVTKIIPSYSGYWQWEGNSSCKNWEDLQKAILCLSRAVQHVKRS